MDPNNPIGFNEAQAREIYSLSNLNREIKNLQNMKPTKPTPPAEAKKNAQSAKGKKIVGFEDKHGVRDTYEILSKNPIGKKLIKTLDKIGVGVTIGSGVFAGLSGTAALGTGTVGVGLFTTGLALSPVAGVGVPLVVTGAALFAVTGIAIGGAALSTAIGGSWGMHMVKQGVLLKEVAKEAESSEKSKQLDDLLKNELNINIDDE